MFDLSWGELMVIGTVALVVIGPKDLPVAIRAVSSFVGQARKLAREFQSGMEQMAREAGVDDLKREVSKMASGEYGQQMKSYVDPDGMLDRPDLPIPEFDAPATTDKDKPPTVNPPATKAAPPLPPVETAEAPGLPFDQLDRVERIDEPVLASSPAGKPA